MSIQDTVRSLLGGSDDGELTATEEETSEEPLSHLCTSCGEEYFTDPEMEIDSCRECGGIKVEQV